MAISKWLGAAIVLIAFIVAGRANAAGFELEMSALASQVQSGSVN